MISATNVEYGQESSGVIGYVKYCVIEMSSDAHAAHGPKFLLENTHDQLCTALTNLTFGRALH